MSAGGGGGGGGAAVGGGGGGPGGVGVAGVFAPVWAGPAGMTESGTIAGKSGTTVGRSGILLPGTEGAIDGPRSAL